MTSGVCLVYSLQEMDILLYFSNVCFEERERKYVCKGKYSNFLIPFAGEDPVVYLSSGGPRNPAQKGSSRIPGRGPLSLGPAGNLQIPLFCNTWELKRLGLMC